MSYFHSQKLALAATFGIAIVGLNHASHAQSAHPVSAVDNPWPSDIDPVSGFRLPLPDRIDLNEAAKKIYDHATRSASLAGLQGPAGVYIYSKAGQQAVSINSVLRRNAGLSPRIREVAILTTAREFDSQFEWSAHEPEGIKAGVPVETIDAIKHHKDLTGLDPTDSLVIELGRDIWRQHKVPSETFQKMKQVFGPQKTIDLVLLMGNYAATAAVLTTVDMQLHHGEKALLSTP